VTDACAPRSVEIGFFVADHPRPWKVEIKILCCFQQHA
jgi:hypothetical protein